MNKSFLVVKATVGNEVSVVDLGPVTDMNVCARMAQEIGNNCDLVEPVKTLTMPKKYYMVCDESGLCKPNRLNRVASLLYGDDIAGNVLFCSETYTEDGPTFAGFTQEEANEWAEKLRVGMLTGFRRVK
jgi:hypothetical protein